VAVVGAPGVVIEGAGRGGKEFNIVLAGRALQSYVAKRARKGKLLMEKISQVAGLSAAKAE
jgi:topoisomerase-4 subunit A